MKLRIPDLVKNKYMSSYSAQIKELEDRIASNKALHVALKGALEEVGPDPGPATSSDAPPSGPTRCLATPDFEGETLPNLERVVPFAEKPVGELRANFRFLE